MPTIALIEKKLTVLNVDGGEDYRMRTLTPAEVFYIPNNAENEAKLSDLFNKLAGGDTRQPEKIIIHERELTCKARTNCVIWFDFRTLCFGTRSQADYLWLAERYTHVLISGVEKMSPNEKNEARRLTLLVDVFYDYRVKLCLTSQVPMEELYTEGDFAHEFVRTVSRLVEMQSEDYLALPHLKLK